MIDFRLNNTTANSTGKKTGAIRKLQVKTEKKNIGGIVFLHFNEG